LSGRADTHVPSGLRWSKAIAVSYVGFAIAFLSNVLVARALGPAGRGEFSLFQATVFALATFSELGIGHGQMFHASRDPRELRHFMPNAIGIAIVLGGTVGALYFSWIAPAYRAELMFLRRPATIAAIMSVPLLMLLSFQRQYLLVIQNVVVSKLSLAGSQAVPLLSVIALAATGSAGLQTMVVAFAIGQCVLVAIFGILIGRAMLVGGTLSLAFAKDALSFGVRQYISDLALILANRLDFFLVGLLLGRAQLGVYAVSVGLAEIVMRLSSELGTMLFPTFAARQLDRERMLMLLRQTTAVALVLGVLLAAFAGPITHLLYGPRYAGAASTMRALLVGTVAWGTIFVTWNFVSASGRPILGAPIFGLAALLDAVLNVILLPRYGVVAAGVASSISYWVAALILLLIFCRMTGCSLSEALVPRRRDVAVMVAAGRNLLKGLV
jgi:O-antigen/teichoic acid export membrane protein